jgi:hypothetical protein
MHPFYLIYYNLGVTPIIEDYTIPDDAMSSLNTIDEYLHDHSIINDNMNPVYTCNGHILHDTTDTSTLRYPILCFLLNIQPPILTTDVHLELGNRLQQLITRIQQRTQEPTFITEPSEHNPIGNQPIGSLSPETEPFIPESNNSGHIDDRSELQSPLTRPQINADIIRLLTEQLLSNAARMGNEHSPNAIPPIVPPIVIPNIVPNVQPIIQVYPYQVQLRQMIDMGFSNHEQIRNSLDLTNGDIDEAITIYMTLTET